MSMKTTLVNNMNTLKDKIDKSLSHLNMLRDEVVKDIIEYFNKNNVIFKYPCVIENPTDTMLGGITITQIRKGQAIEATNDYEHASYDVSELDDDTLLRLYEWKQFGN